MLCGLVPRAAPRVPPRREGGGRHTGRRRGAMRGAKTIRGRQCSQPLAAPAKRWPKTQIPTVAARLPRRAVHQCCSLRASAAHRVRVRLLASGRGGARPAPVPVRRRGAPGRCAPLPRRVGWVWRAPVVHSSCAFRVFRGRAEGVPGIALGCGGSRAGAPALPLQGRRHGGVAARKSQSKTCSHTSRGSVKKYKRHGGAAGGPRCDPRPVDCPALHFQCMVNPLCLPRRADKRPPPSLLSPFPSRALHWRSRAPRGWRGCARGWRPSRKEREL